MISMNYNHAYVNCDVYVFIWANRSSIIIQPHYPLSNGKTNLMSVNRVVVTTIVDRNKWYDDATKCALYTRIKE